MDLMNASLRIIHAGQAPSGAYVASPTFSQYGYCWLRDGAWIAYGMDCVGEHASARAFYEWVGRTLRDQQPRLERLLAKLERGDTPVDADYLPTRFTLDGGLGTAIWEDFQLDGYGTWLWGVCAHLDATGDAALWDQLLPAVKLTVTYLAALWQSPNYDCWEEFRDKIHVSTLAAIYGGLTAIERRDPALVPAGLTTEIREFTLRGGITPDGHLGKFFGNEAVDASLLWVAVPYGLLDVHDPRFLRTLARIEQDLYRPGGGVYRYAADTYYGGGEWILLAAWLGWTYARLDRRADAERLLQWVEAQATPEGELPEQVCDYQLDDRYFDEWVARWGTVASPLLWSHAMVLVLRSVLGQTTP